MMMMELSDDEDLMILT